MRFLKLLLQGFVHLKVIVLIFHPVVQLTLFILLLEQMHIAVESMALSTLKDLLLELWELFTLDVVAPGVLLESTETLPEIQLRREH